MLVLKILSLLLISVDVHVDLLNGQSAAGALKALNDQSVTVQTEDDTRTIELNQVVSVTTTHAEPVRTTPTACEVILNDGSQFPGEFQELTARNLTARSVADIDLIIPRAAIRAVRLQPPNRDWSAEWDAFRKRSNQDDLLILQKRDGTGLDFYEGVVSAATSAGIDFVLDGESIPVPRDRVYGLVFAESKQVAPSEIIVELAGSGRIAASQTRLADDHLHVVTAWDQTLVIPLPEISRIDFSRGRFHYLSDLDPVRETYYGTQPEGSLLEDLLKDEDLLGAEALSLWKLHRDELPMGPFGPQRLTLRGQVYQKGIWLFPHCRIDYALDGRYTTFQTIAGVDDEVAFNISDSREPSRVRLTILTDGDEAWNELIEAPADPVTIRLDVSSAQTLSILVDFGDNDSACDFLDLADARLLLVRSDR